MKAAAASVLACAVCLLLKKPSPELGLGLSVTVCVGGLAMAAVLLEPILGLLSEARELSGLSEALFYPVMKSVGIGVCAKLSADICKDSGQAAIAGTMETLGAVCALYTAMPLMETLLAMLEELI